ncbi:tyrosine-type recombinase/integrase [Aureispira anguillae]|uniref:Site-specific integrase n=1 Tax=Aureispira anguillae TaxID=2864201 RepID=A0A916DUH5_9BACT|nr:site-specific integrase [Aureispira anguillae]BDS12702.1 site-specific integrase [Aureispira anguillae]
MITGKKILPKLHDYGGNTNKQWFIHFYDDEGKRIRIYKGINHLTTAKQRHEAAQRIIKQILQTRKGLTHQKIKAAIIDALENRKPTWRKKTYQCKKSKIFIFLEWMENKDWIEKSIKDFFQYLTNKHINPSTYNDYILNVRNALQWIGEEDLIKDVQRRKKSPVPAAYFTRSQIDYLSKVMKNKDPQLWFFVQFIYYCFLRPRTELRHLKVGDIMLEDQKIVVHPDIAKNKKLQYITIPDAFFPVVQKKIQGRNPNEYLFEGKQYLKPMGENTMGERHRLLLKELSFDTKRYKMYSWKHTGAVMAVKAGVHVKQLQIQLRHHSLDQVDEYLRQLGVSDLGDLRANFPGI